MKDASKRRANRIVFDSDSDAEANTADEIEQVNHVQPDKQVNHTVYCLLPCILMF